MHWKRWITALIALPLIFLLIFKGGPSLFTLTIIIVGTITLWEYFRIVYHGHTPPVPVLYTSWGYLSGALIVVAARFHQLEAMIGLLALNLIGVAMMSIFRFKSSQDAPIVALKQMFGVVYISLFLSFGVLLFIGPEGHMWILFLLWVIAAGDTGAYYVGTYLGRHKLSPAVSPNKSIEGAVGGLLSNLLLGIAFKLLFFNEISWSTCMIFSLLVGAVGQAGDLFESEFKRAAGIKDSGGLLPGHGGFLDRLDALLFALPLAYLLKEYLLV